MRLVDADELLKKLAVAPMVQEAMRKAFDHMPTIDVVRCKDCKWQKFIDWGMGDCLHPKGSKHIAYDNHYCSYGERREDANE